MINITNAYARMGALIARAAELGALKKAVFSKPDDRETVRTTVTLRALGGGTVAQAETLRADHKALHENIPVNDCARFCTLAQGFAQVNLLTTGGECEYRRSNRGSEVLLGGDKLRRRLSDNGAEAISIGGNNKEKKHILQGNEPFLQALGVSDKNGRIYDKKQPKFRQINRFLELISDVRRSLPDKRIRILDLCCGKSYLSFAVYHYFANVLKMEVSMTGVDLKSDVMDYCNEVSQSLCFNGLEFLCGDVGAYETDDLPDLVISLHACDTATDLVLDRALTFGAKVILATPCCHHQLNHTLNCSALEFVAEHSMLRQKLCDAATDALRLKWLEAHGYEVAALELIDPDDTPKNIMLRAIRRADAGSGTAAERRALAEYQAAKDFLLGG